MFDFLKKNKKPEPIFEILGTDMHNHLVPCVDDGSRSAKESIECIRTMQQLGYKRMYITPHFQFPRFPNDEDDIRQRYESLKKTLIENGVTMELAGVAGEYRIDDSFAHRMETSRFLKIDDKYVLVELSLHQQRMGVEEVIFDLHVKGYEVILAHPERYPYFNVHSPMMEHLKEQGVLFQLNVLSLGGFYGEGAQRRAFDLLNAGWVEFLGTDMHNTMYAHALCDLSHNRKVRKALEKYQFMNSTL